MRSLVADKLLDVRNRIEKAAVGCGRLPQSIRLVAVAKTHPPELIREAAAAGLTIVGENYIQEARSHFEALFDLPVSWHFIGHLQSNKAKYAVRMFDLIHTVDSIKLAAALDQQAQKAGKIQHVLIQVNISGEKTKAGVPEQAAADLIYGIRELRHIKIQGLMTMPPFFDQPGKARPYFAALRRLSEHIRSQKIPNVEMNELSMGMTGDFETAVQEGATLVRIGTAIFGDRR